MKVSLEQHKDLIKFFMEENTSAYQLDAAIFWMFFQTIKMVLVYLKPVKDTRSQTCIICLLKSLFQTVPLR